MIKKQSSVVSIVEEGKSISIPVKDSGAQAAFTGEKDEEVYSFSEFFLESNQQCYPFPSHGGFRVHNLGSINADKYSNSLEVQPSKYQTCQPLPLRASNFSSSIMRPAAVSTERDTIKDDTNNFHNSRNLAQSSLAENDEKFELKDRLRTTEQFSLFNDDQSQSRFDQDNTIKPLSEFKQSIDLNNNKSQQQQQKEQQEDNSATPLIWRKKFFKLLLLSNRFLFNTKRVLRFFHPCQLTESQLCTIGDKAAHSYQEAQQVARINRNDSYKPRKRSHFQKRVHIAYLQFKKRIKFIIQPIGQFVQFVQRQAIFIEKSIPLVNPFGVVMLIWDFVLMIVSFYNLFIIPYEICFDLDAYSQHHSWLNKISLIVYFMDMMISMNTGNYIKGELEQDRIKVFKIYLKEHLLNDMICLCCLIFVDPLGNELLRLLFLLKIIKLSKLVEKNREYFQIDDKYSSATNLVLLLVKIMYLCHLFACFWYKLGRFVQSQGDASWLDNFERSNPQQSNEDLYISAIYYSAITITTVGYGDITPKSKYERLFIFFMAFLSCANFGYALNKIGSIIQEMNAKKETYRHSVAILNKYMKQCEVPKVLQSKARRYLEYVDSQSSNFGNPQELVFSQLSNQLQMEIKKEVCLKTLRRISFLFERFSEQCLNKLSMIVQEKCFNIGETIIDQSEFSEPGLFYIIQGEACAYVSHQKQLKPFARLTNGRVFGQASFFLQNNSNSATIISSSPMMVHLIPLADFLTVLSDFPKEREIYSFYKDSALLNKDYSLMHLACLSCKSSSHQIGQCPYLAYHPQKQKVIGNYIREQSDFRKIFQRKSRRFSPQKKLAQTQKGAFQLQMELQEELGYDGSENESHPSLNNIQKNTIEKIESNDQRDSLTRTSQIFFPNNCSKRIRLSQDSNANTESFKNIENNTSLSNNNNNTNSSNNGQVCPPLKLLEYNLMSPSSRIQKKAESRINHSHLNIQQLNTDQNQKKAPNELVQQDLSNCLIPSTFKLPHSLQQYNQQSVCQDQGTSTQNIQNLLTLILKEIQAQNNQQSQKHLEIMSPAKIKRRSYQQTRTTKPYSDFNQPYQADKFLSLEYHQWLEGNGEIGVSLQAEAMKQFEIYFPQNNVTAVLNRLFQRSLKIEQFVRIYGKLNQHKNRKHNQQQLQRFKTNSSKK